MTTTGQGRGELTVCTPDRVATARLRGGSSVTVSLAPGHFGRSTPNRLAEELATLGRLLWRAEHLPDRDRPDRMTACAGRSRDGSVYVRRAGRRSWTFELEPAAYTRGEAAFCAAAGEAIAAALGGGA